MTGFFVNGTHDSCIWYLMRVTKPLLRLLRNATLLFMAVASTSLADTPVVGSFNGHYYQLVADSSGFDWYQARDAASHLSAHGLPGYLATITTVEEHAFISHAIPQAAMTWLGAIDARNRGWFSWVTGESAGYPIGIAGMYASWAAGQPDGGSAENCLVSYGGSSSWSDEDCNEKLHYMLVEYSAPILRTFYCGGGSSQTGPVDEASIDAIISALGTIADPECENNNIRATLFADRLVPLASVPVYLESTATMDPNFNHFVNSMPGEAFCLNITQSLIDDSGNVVEHGSGCDFPVVGLRGEDIERIELLVGDETEVDYDPQSGIRTYYEDITINFYGSVEVQREVINFEGIPAGKVVKKVYTDSGFGPIKVRGRLGNACTHNAAVVFDSSCPSGVCSGNDQDLGTPNQTFSGPGEGKGGQIGSPWANDTSLGNLLIVHEACNELADRFVENPNDTKGDSRITLKFPQPVRVFSYTIIDNERDERDRVKLFGDQGERLAMLTSPATGNNGKAVVQTTSDGTGIGGVTRMVFDREGSRGIDNIVILPEASLFTNPADFNRATEDLDKPVIIDFQDIDASPVDNTISGRDEFDGNLYAAQGITFSNPNGIPLFIAPGGLFWNASNSLSVGAFPFDPASATVFNEDDDLVMTFDPPCSAVGFTFVDNRDVGNDDEFVQFKDVSGRIVTQAGFPDNFADFRAFLGIVSPAAPISSITVVEAPNDGDDINYDDVICFRNVR